MKYKVLIDAFEGPLDLLLHLIKQSDISIFDINIEQITQQYLEYIHQMEELNLDIASEYLVMAASLIEMKSRILLPNSKEVNDEDDNIDPKTELINRLIEYEKYKNKTDELKLLATNRQAIHTRLPYDMTAYIDQDIDFENATITDLMQAFAKFLEQKALEKPLNTKITTKEYSVHERSEQIKNMLKQKKKMMFQELFTIMKKDYIIVTFLSVLELAKKQELKIEQENNFQQIYILAKE